MTRWAAISPAGYARLSRCRKPLILLARRPIRRESHVVAVRIVTFHQCHLRTECNLLNTDSSYFARRDHGSRAANEGEATRCYQTISERYQMHLAVEHRRGGPRADRQGRYLCGGSPVMPHTIWSMGSGSVAARSTQVKASRKTGRLSGWGPGSSTGTTAQRRLLR